MSEDHPIRRFWEWLRGTPTESPASLPEVSESSAEPELLRSQGETWLHELATACSEGRRIEEIGGEEFWQQIRSMWRDGHEKLAVEWLGKFIAATSTPEDIVPSLRARLVERLEERGDLGPGVTHLQALLDVPEHSVRAHFLLAEHHRRRGDEVAAMRHYESVLARDMNYPNARIRLDRLRKRRGRQGPASLAATIAGGDLAGGGAGSRYHLVRELGRGATAVVYLARDRELERDVAVKLLHPHLAAAEQAHACTEFFAEARMAASLRHPNIIAILDADEASRRLVMELAAGGTLRMALSTSGAMSPRLALSRHVQTLAALSAAHERGIVHRDVKPGNLMFRRDPEAPGVEIALGDFGVANLPEAAQRSKKDETEAETRARGGVVGTLAYMPPEQRRGDDVTGKVDVYASAVVLYETLTGKHPLSRTRILEGARGADDFRLPEEIAVSLPATLRTRLQEHLDELSQADPAQRPESDEALRRARELRDRAVVAEQA